MKNSDDLGILGPNDSLDIAGDSPWNACPACLRWMEHGPDFG